MEGTVGALLGAVRERRDGEPAGEGSAACCCARRCAGCATRSTRRRRAARSCSACGGSPSSPHGSFGARGHRARRSSSRRAASRADVVGRTHAALEAAGRAAARPPEPSAAAATRARSMTRDAGPRPDPGAPGRRAASSTPRGSRRRPASRRISRRTRSTSTRWCRSSRTPTACDVRRAGGAHHDRRPGGGLRARAAGRDGRDRRRPRAEALTAGALRDLLERLPDDLARQAVTHASWTEHRADSYERLAFLGDSRARPRRHHAPVPAPGGGALRRRPADEDPRPGGLGRSCRAVAERLGMPERLRAAAPPDAAPAARRRWSRTERVLASVIEAVIGACYLALRLRADRGGGASRRSGRRSSRRWRARRTSSRRCRSGSRGAATVVPTR